MVFGGFQPWPSEWTNKQFFEILAIFKVNYWVRRIFSHDMTLYTVLFTLCSNKINKEKIVVLQLLSILFDQISPKWVRFRWWLQVLESKLPQTWSYNILFFHKFCVDLKYNQKISLGSGYVNNRTFWLRSDLIVLIMKKYSDSWYLSAFALSGINICIVFFICMFYFRNMESNKTHGILI